MNDLKITHAPDRNRFEVDVEGEVAHLDYERLDDKTVDYQSTWVPPAARDRGVGHRLVDYALRWAEQEGLVVIPTCPFVADVIRENEGLKDSGT
jgi:predicted GNAT family acetyltransferase